MGLDRVRRDLELPRHLLRRTIGSQELQYFAFPGREAERPDSGVVAYERWRRAAPGQPLPGPQAKAGKGDSEQDDVDFSRKGARQVAVFEPFKPRDRKGERKRVENDQFRHDGTLPEN